MRVSDVSKVISYPLGIKTGGFKQREVYSIHIVLIYLVWAYHCEIASPTRPHNRHVLYFIANLVK